MYTPNIFPNDIFSLWGKEGSNNSSRLYGLDHKKRDPHQHNGASNHSAYQNNHNGNSNTNDSLSPEHSDEQRMYLRSLFAPPLVAYSAEYPGASVSQLEYTIKTQSAGLLNAPLLTPLTQRKLERTRRIRNLGYTTIVPIGIDKTMEQIDYDESRKYALTEQEDQSFVPTAENSTSDNHDQSTARGADTSINGVGSIISTDVRDEVNLDDQIINSDEYHQYSDNFEDSDNNDEDGETIGNTRYEPISDDDEDTGFGDNVINDDEGFMADEVEYQDDHSINNEIGVGSSSKILIDSGVTSGTSATLVTTATSNNLNSNHSIPTSTSASSIGIFDGHSNVLGSSRLYSSIRECDEDNEENQENERSRNEIDIENVYGNVTENQQESSDHSDLDMVIDD